VTKQTAMREYKYSGERSIDSGRRKALKFMSASSAALIGASSLTGSATANEQLVEIDSDLEVEELSVVQTDCEERNDWGHCVEHSTDTTEAGLSLSVSQLGSPHNSDEETRVVIGWSAGVDEVDEDDSSYHLDDLRIVWYPWNEEEGRVVSGAWTTAQTNGGESNVGEYMKTGLSFALDQIESVPGLSSLVSLIDLSEDENIDMGLHDGSNGSGIEAEFMSHRLSSSGTGGSIKMNWKANQPGDVNFTCMAFATIREESSYGRGIANDYHEFYTQIQDSVETVR